MLWINLIMDTFAALALSSLPPDNSVMRNKPRSRKAFIIGRKMARRILGVGLAFVVVLFGFLQYFAHCDVQTLADFSLRDYLFNFFNFKHVHDGVSDMELSMLFTIFVFMQFWNIFNANNFLGFTSYEIGDGARTCVEVIDNLIACKLCKFACNGI